MFPLSARDLQVWRDGGMQQHAGRGSFRRAPFQTLVPSKSRSPKQVLTLHGTCVEHRRCDAHMTLLWWLHVGSECAQLGDKRSGNW